MTECRVCHLPKASHDGEKITHQFVGPDDPIRLIPSSAKSSSDQSSSARGDAQGNARIATGGDPVLRMALIRAGVITVEDLDRVEQELKATGVSGYEPARTLG